jgi:hypothetical protein
MSEGYKPIVKKVSDFQQMHFLCLHRDIFVKEYIDTHKGLPCLAASYHRKGKPFPPRPVTPLVHQEIRRVASRGKGLAPSLRARGGMKFDKAL